MSTTPPPPWTDAVFTSEALGPLVLQSAEVPTLLALRRTGRGLKAASDREFSLADARRRVRQWARHVPRGFDGALRDRAGVFLMQQLAKEGNLRLIQWARCGARVPWDEHVTAWAAFHGHIHVIQWMCFEAQPPMSYAQRGVPASQYPNQDAVGIECAHAAKAGRLDVLDWLRTRNFVMGPQTCHEAVSEGHLHIVRRVCCVCDPKATWIPLLVKLLQTAQSLPLWHPSSFVASYTSRWLPILEWYLPFATMAEWQELTRVLPEEAYRAMRLQ